MDGLLQTHSSTIPILARGFVEARKHISPEEVTSFIDEHLRSASGRVSSRSSWLRSTVPRSYMKIMSLAQAAW
ncbi:hypothetical protein MRB53_038644 [Persea americana]|nr:hypothetical protein MRB53_038644 [Persea americana]